MIEARMSHRALIAVLTVLALGACEARKETGPEEKAVTPAPEVAAPVVPAVVDPAAARPLESFSGMDVDGDGFISSAEYAKAAQTMFRLTDADHDGLITVAEMDAAERAVSDGATPSSEKTIAASDGDGDGQLTLAEYVGGSNGLFAKIDANADTRLDRAEWDAAHAMPAATATTPAG